MSSLWHCLACTTAYAVGLPACPHCRSTSKEEDGVMPKTTVHGGASYEGHVDVSSPDTAAPEWAPAPEVVEPQKAAEPVAVEDAPVEPEAKPAPRHRSRKS